MWVSGRARTALTMLDGRYHSTNVLIWEGIWRDSLLRHKWFLAYLLNYLEWSG